ncbi:MAG: hypothetical protein RBT05_03775 [Bacteroidales bacterium]|jgi:hypothetical protein|nr:hypothetical protein [Bacteroidales bacterium]
MGIINKFCETYNLIKNLSHINGADVNEMLLNRAMFSIEKLPPLGKEYWWFLFFGQDGERPVQITLLIFRKHGKKMLFNHKKMRFNELSENEVLAVTSGWIYDGDELRKLPDTNAITILQEDTITSEISGSEMVFSGSYPNYLMTLGDLINLKMENGNFIETKDAYGVFLPPLGVGWVDVFSDANGTVLGKKFKGTAHLQKVVGVAPFGPFHWARIVFKNHSVFSFFCLKMGKESHTFLHKSIKFFDTKNQITIRLNNPKLEVSRIGDNWIIEGIEKNKHIRAVLEIYATNRYDMKGGGSQVYIQYAVIPKELTIKDDKNTFTLSDLGEGVGTIEDAYW